MASSGWQNQDLRIVYIPALFVSFRASINCCKFPLVRISLGSAMVAWAERDKQNQFESDCVVAIRSQVEPCATETSTNGVRSAGPAFAEFISA